MLLATPSERDSEVISFHQHRVLPTLPQLWMGQGRTTGAWSYPQLWHMVILMAFALTRLSPLFTAKTHLSDLLAMTDCLLHHYSYLTHSLFLLRRATAHEDCGTKYPWVGSEGLIK